MGHPRTARIGVLVALMGVAACTAQEPSASSSTPPVTTSATRSPTDVGSSRGTASPTGATQSGSTQSGGAASPTGDSPTPDAGPSLVVVRDVRVSVEDVVRGLDAPWGIAFLPGGSLLVSLRDQARLVVVDPASGAVHRVTGPGADDLRENTVAHGESGALGIAVLPDAPAALVAPDTVFVYRTAAEGNEVLRGTLAGRELSALTPVVTGIPAGTHHDGGRLAIGPDGFLYVATGDAGERGNAQDPRSLGGKILRVTTDGDPALGNPDPGSPVWTLGHRNVQGLAWDATGRMFASEFGQNTFDELNVVVPGANYGWPEREGTVGAEGGGFEDPVVTWATSDASPSGIAVTRDGVYLAALRGERLWRVPFARGDGQALDAVPSAFGEPEAVLTDLGRLRAVAVDPARPSAPDGSSVLYVLTNNTDGRGTPRAGDDRLVRVTVTPAR